MKRRWPNPSFLDFSSLVGHPPRSVQINSLLHRLAFRLRRTCIKRGKFYIVEVHCVPSTVYSPVFYERVKGGPKSAQTFIFQFSGGENFIFQFTPHIFTVQPLRSFSRFTPSFSRLLHFSMSLSLTAFGIKLKAQKFMGKMHTFLKMVSYIGGSSRLLKKVNQLYKALKSGQFWLYAPKNTLKSPTKNQFLSTNFL